MLREFNFLCTKKDSILSFEGQLLQIKKGKILSEMA